MSKSHNQQQDQSDCGVVCLKTILNYFDSDASLERLREYSGTSSNGTTMLGLLQCANKIGLETKGFEATIEILKETKEITILHILIENELQHYIVCFGYNNKKDAFLISNPSNAKTEYISSEELDIIWQSKALLLCKPTENLPKKKQTRKQKTAWLLHYVKEDMNLLSMALLLGVLLAILSLATAVYSQKLIDVLLPSKDSFKIYSSVALLFFLFLITAFIGYIRSLFLIRQSRDFNIRVIGYFYGNLLKLPKLFFDTRKIGDMVARMNDTSRIQRTVANIIGNIMIDILMIFVTTIAIFSYDKRLGYITLLWITIYGIIVFYFNPKIIKAQRSTMQAYAKNESNYIDTINGIETIKANNKESVFSNKTNAVYEFFQTAVYNLSKLSLNFGVVNDLISSIFIIGTITFSIYLIIEGSITAGVIIAILQLVGILMNSTSNLAMANIQIQEAKIAIDRMFEFTSLESDSKKGFNIESFQSLEIKNLSFRFAGRSQLLKNINL
ncbi:hypothetical protein EGM88_14900 [Aureibaculum marinum]|uniref:Peptidase domain-containing ABC transporter n=1 Tax=Aureibaculum marinum TaxID=2487930 RepID=A0A3N4NVR3_9FLAO|nr:ABC transporter transmembrane domain-containing protein [Aureibaculum marinum]RPD91223.1 hypothetical protein EGM88_14900 [Aureibaculum marinum]